LFCAQEFAQEPDFLRQKVRHNSAENIELVPGPVQKNKIIKQRSVQEPPNPPQKRASPFIMDSDPLDLANNKFINQELADATQKL
jgi:hypothetical protein